MRENSIIHYRYALAFSIFVTIEILTGWWYKTPDMVQILGFGLSLSSLVLAIIAIIQAIVSGASLSHIIGSISTSVDEVRSATKAIGDVSSQLMQHAAAIPTALSEVSQRIDRLLNASPSAAQVIAEIAAAPERGHPAEMGAEANPAAYTLDLLNRATFGGKISYYLCAVAREHEKHFDPIKVFAARPGQIGTYAQGFVAALRSASVMEIGLDDGHLYTLQP